MKLKGKIVYVIGLGPYGTGDAVVRVAYRQGARVVAADEKEPEQLKAQLSRLKGVPVELELGAKAYQSLQDSDLVVISPGVPLDIAPLQKARAKGIPVVSEIEVASWLSRAPIIAVTGTKGKTTTASLIGQLLRDAGRSVLVGGNIGSPLIEHAVQAQPEDLLVAEVSSFQLEAIDTFRPKVAVFLNFSEDHGDRYRTLDEYWQAKVRLFRNQTAQDFAVLNFDDRAIRDLAQELAAQMVPVSSREEIAGGTFIREGWICVSRSLPGLIPELARPEEDPLPLCRTDSLRLLGKHNLDNALAAAATVATLGVPLDGAGEALSQFEAVPNRLEQVAAWGGITFINDSQATTPVAVIKALEAIDRPICLIAGGKPKVSDFSSLAQAIAQRVDYLVTIGQAGPEIAQQAQAAGCARVEQADSLPQAVELAYGNCPAGGVVLLSPACASFDMFENMAHRGQVFKEAVSQLQKGEKDETARRTS